MTTAKHPNLAAYPNLTPRPIKPSRNRGPIQVRARRALRALGVASTSQISEWAHPRGSSRRNVGRRNSVAMRLISASTPTPDCPDGLDQPSAAQLDRFASRCHVASGRGERT
jgi:hypothetical protein